MIKCNKCTWTINPQVYGDNEELFLSVCISHAEYHHRQSLVKKNFHLVGGKKKK